MKIRFLSYDETPGEKSTIGVATIVLTLEEKDFLVRYKINMGKTGGIYISPAAMKIGDKYEPSFLPDSNIVIGEIEKIIKSNMTKSKNIREPSPQVDYKYESTEEKVPF